MGFPVTRAWALMSCVDRMGIEKVKVSPGARLLEGTFSKPQLPSHSPKIQLHLKQLTGTDL